MAGISRIKDIKSPYLHHNIYPDNKLGFVCIHRETEKVLASDKNKRKCEEKSRIALSQYYSELGGEHLGEKCLYKKDKRYRTGTIIDSYYDCRYHGLVLFFSIRDTETSTIMTMIESSLVLKNSEFHRQTLNNLFSQSENLYKESQENEDKINNLERKLAFKE